MIKLVYLCLCECRNGLRTSLKNHKVREDKVTVRHTCLRTAALFIFNLLEQLAGRISFAGFHQSLFLLLFMKEADIVVL